MIPRSGGQYAFSRYALGEYPGFIVGWSDWLSTCGTTAAVSLVIAEFSGALFPAVAAQQTAVAASVAIVFAIAQWKGIHEGSLVQNVTSALKAAALGVLVVAAFARPATTSAADAVPQAPAALRPRERVHPRVAGCDLHVRRGGPVSCISQRRSDARTPTSLDRSSAACSG
jgi:APA family basic amino acid/polyamine antiporter